MENLFLWGGNLCMNPVMDSMPDTNDNPEYLKYSFLPLCPMACKALSLVYGCPSILHQQIFSSMHRINQYLHNLFHTNILGNKNYFYQICLLKTNKNYSKPKATMICTEISGTTKTPSRPLSHEIKQLIV